MPASVAFSDDLRMSETPISNHFPPSASQQNEPTVANSASGSASNNSMDLPESLLTTNCKKFVIWSRNTAEDFSDWYETTCWYQRAQSPNCEYNLPTWQMKNKTALELWSNFEQLANVRTGEAKIKCITCLMLLAHPATNNEGGTSSMKSHRVMKRCRTVQWKENPGQFSGSQLGDSMQPTLQESIRKSASTLRVSWKKISKCLISLKLDVCNGNWQIL